MDRYLNVFISVAEQQSFSKAAKLHHMTQPAVSQYIRTLEERMNTKLLDRNNKRVHLNKAGEIVYHYSKEIMGMYERMHYLVDDLNHTANGPLKIGASYTFGEYILPHIIAKTKEHCPEVQPIVTIGNTEEIAALVENHQLDIGIVEGHFKNRTLIPHKFAEDEMIIVATPTHPLLQKSHITHHLLETQTWIVREEGSGTREALNNVFKLLAISPNNLIRFSSTQPIKASVESGLGISFLSKWAVKKELARGELVAVDMNFLPYKRTFAYLTHSPFQTKSLEVFIDILCHHQLD
ncbi:LysR family transcriptional regulator [Staphylococcus arlettae]|uniref:LysR family transcriptional regulator n=1 Tax=Staphylococcus arlettae TaxID=29378 RepID=UPI003EDFA423